MKQILLAGAAILIPATAFAQTVEPAPAEPAAAEDTYHDSGNRDIIVTAPFTRNRIDVLSGTTVVTGVELTRELQPTIGETLARQPGVSATSFGPNASRPVLRGFQGERVRVLTDGIGSFDASNTSVDHAVAINPLTADRIEILRGPSALLFGSSAIGGVVNVIDSRIPREIPDEVVHVEALGRYGTAADERAASGAIDLPVAGKIVLHVDGSYTKTNDLETGGSILTPALRARAAASPVDDIAELADLEGRLPNSASETYEYAGGVAIVTETGNLGISVSRYDSLYGVPIRYSLDPDVEAEAVRLDVRQTRFDLRGEVETGGGFLSTIRLRAGYADYEHDELEDTGEIGTSFFNNAYEARLELVQARRGGWEGAVGGQLFIRDFSIIGAEKFLPETETQQFGVFTLQSVDFGAFRAEAGARFEHSIVEADADAALGNANIRRSFDAYSGSIGASVGLTERVRLGLNASYTERAPAPEELFARGNHAGTQAFELGDPGFVKERSKGVEATLRATGNGYSFEASAYYNDFDNYISENQVDQSVCELATGADVELPCFLFTQDDAEYYGFEVEGSARLFRFGETAIVIDGLADYVRATLDRTGPVPRIPPLRLLGGIEAQAEQFQLRAEIEHSFEQDHVTGFETRTEDFTLVNASLSFAPFGAGNRTSIVLSANNIFDVEARRHASFLKDYAPLAGRDFRATARISF